MPTLGEQIERTLRPGMTMPEPLRKLFGWMEENNCILVGKDGKRTGVLHPAPPSGRLGQAPGCQASFAAEDQTVLEHWFGHSRPEVLDRLCVFASTGGDGSMGAFWLDEQNRQRIVHLGSGSGSTMVCVLAEEPVDFLRLLAVGTAEICWDHELSQTPEESAALDGGEFKQNTLFRGWVERTFGVTIPSKGIEIVKHPCEMYDEDPADRFCRWVNANL